MTLHTSATGVDGSAQILVPAIVYTETAIDPVALTTRPWHDTDLSTNPALVLVPAPGPGLALQLDGLLITATEGEPWSFDDLENGLVYIGKGGGAADARFVAYTGYSFDVFLDPVRNHAYGSDAPMIVGTDTAGQPAVGLGGVRASQLGRTASYYYRPVLPNRVFEDAGASSVVPVNAPIVARMIANATGGSQTHLLRVYYHVVAAVGIPATHARITAVNQGLHQFTLADPTAIFKGATGSVRAVGAGGNTGRYTVTAASHTPSGLVRAPVPATRGAPTPQAVGDTTILTVAQPIPSATVGGWVTR